MYAILTITVTIHCDFHYSGKCPKRKSHDTDAFVQFSSKLIKHTSLDTFTRCDIKYKLNISRKYDLNCAICYR